MSFLQSLAGAIAWIAGLWMVFKLFQKKGVLHGILGFICELYPFIWGLINFKDPEIKQPMTIWLAAIGISIVLGIIGAITDAGGSASLLSFFI